MRINDATRVPINESPYTPVSFKTARRDSFSKDSTGLAPPSLSRNRIDTCRRRRAKQEAPLLPQGGKAGPHERRMLQNARCVGRAYAAPCVASSARTATNCGGRILVVQRKKINHFPALNNRNRNRNLNFRFKKAPPFLRSRRS